MFKKVLTMSRILFALFVLFGCHVLQAEDKKPVPPPYPQMASPVDAAAPVEGSGDAPAVEMAPEGEAPKVGGAYENAFVKMFLMLLLLIVLVFFTIWMFKRLSHGRIRLLNNTRSIKILERRPLSAKSILYLVEVGGKQVLVSESQAEVRSLAVFDEEPPLDED